MKPKKVLEIEHEGQVYRFYVRLNESRTQFSLFVATAEPLTNEVIYQLINIFADEKALDEMIEGISH